MKKLLPIVLTVLVLVLLYANLDRQAIWQHLKGIHLGWLLLALGIFVPQILLSAWRWQIMVGGFCRMGLWETARLILAGKALNALVPSKLGETSKAYFLKTRADLPLSTGVSLVLLEKGLDVASLCIIMLVGLALLPRLGPVEVASAVLGLCGVLGMTAVLTVRTRRIRRRLPEAGLWRKLRSLLEGWDVVLDAWKRAPGRFAAIVALSCLLWVLNAAQMFLYFPALRSHVPLRVMIPYVPISIFVGLLPITLGGMGTRDSALIFLFAPYESAAAMAGIGILCSLRYWMDTLFGLPFFHAFSLARAESEPSANR